ncbi:MAG: histidinol-phosphatase [Firmicutes bacterium]|nr:histidinol-phosphatase [Bacillota bacterium]
MIDFHTHFLPCIDDGSKSVEMSVQMLKMSRSQGVDEIVATPHFYASRVTPADFVARRNAAWERLRAELTPDAPRVHLGAEVYYWSGMSHSDELSKLCIEGTNVLLLEMPFKPWTDRMKNEAASIARDGYFTVVMAHIDRYLKTEPNSTWDFLARNGALFQLNTEPLLHEGFMMRRRALKLLRDEVIYVIASDCHNTDTRSPNMGDAAEVIEKHIGRGAVERLTDNARELLPASERAHKGGNF